MQAASPSFHSTPFPVNAVKSYDCLLITQHQQHRCPPRISVLVTVSLKTATCSALSNCDRLSQSQSALVPAQDYKATRLVFSCLRLQLKDLRTALSRATAFIATATKYQTSLGQLTLQSAHRRRPARCSCSTAPDRPVGR